MEDKEKKSKLKWEFLSLSGYNSFVHVYIKDNKGCICARQSVVSDSLQPHGL